MTCRLVVKKWLLGRQYTAEFDFGDQGARNLHVIEDERAIDALALEEDVWLRPMRSAIEIHLTHCDRHDRFLLGAGT